MQSAVVTGVSTGIGWGITKVLIQYGFRVIGVCGRRRMLNGLPGNLGFK